MVDKKGSEDMYAQRYSYEAQPKYRLWFRLKKRENIHSIGLKPKFADFLSIKFKQKHNPPQPYELSNYLLAQNIGPSALQIPLQLAKKVST